MQTLSSLLCTWINGMVSWKFRTDPLCFYSNTSPASSSTSFVLRFTCSLNMLLFVLFIPKVATQFHSASHMRHLTAQVTLLQGHTLHTKTCQIVNSTQNSLRLRRLTRKWTETIKAIQIGMTAMMIKPSKPCDLLIISLAPVGSRFYFQMQC